MQAMMQFNTWFLQEMPAFLLAEPVNYLFGLILLAYVFKIFFNIFRKGGY